MEKLLLSSLLTLTYFQIWAQDSLPTILNSRVKNNITAGLLGDGSYLSFQYDRIIPAGTSLISAQFGLGFNQELQIDLPCFLGPCPPDLPPEKFIVINYGLSANFGSNRHFIEIGAGSTHAFGLVYETTSNIPYLKIGYRFQPQIAGKFTFRANMYYPIQGFRYFNKYIFYPVGVSLGTSF